MITYLVIGNPTPMPKAPLWMCNRGGEANYHTVLDRSGAAGVPALWDQRWTGAGGEHEWGNDLHQ